MEVIYFKLKKEINAAIGQEGIKVRIKETDYNGKCFSNSILNYIKKLI